MAPSGGGTGGRGPAARGAGAGALRADPHWLFAVVEGGLIAARGEREVEIGVDAPLETRRLLLDQLTSRGGIDAARLAEIAGSELAEAEELRDRLRDAGALVASPPDPAPAGVRLGDAILAVARARPVGRWVWTAEELLVLPDGADPALARSALRAFVAGIGGEARLRAYCFLAAGGEPTAWGDVPRADGLGTARELADGLDPAAVHVIGLDGGRIDSAPAARIGDLGAARPHRLGTIVAETALELPGGLPGGLHHRLAFYSLAGLRRPRPARERIGGGTAADPELAGLMARAEAAERYAASDVERHRVLRARASDLEGAVEIGEIVRPNRRQREARGETGARGGPLESWIRAEAGDGSPRWVPARAVFLGFEDGGAPGAPGATSSGLAAHGERGEAVERALDELIERDSFLWHWVQRVSRERIDPRSLGSPLRERLAAIEAYGFEASLVNLTLDSRPVVLCGLVRDRGIFLGAGCGAVAASAAEKALSEALLVAATIRADPGPGPSSLAEVVSPRDHALLHRRPAMAAENRFLVSSPETIGVDEIPALEGSAAEAGDRLGGLLTVELSSPATRPFSVVRALVPGLVPIAFGHDREPLGMPRLAEPKRTLDGRTLGRRIELADAGPLVPHPFA